MIETEKIHSKLKKKFKDSRRQSKCLFRVPRCSCSARCHYFAVNFASNSYVINMKKISLHVVSVVSCLCWLSAFAICDVDDDEAWVMKGILIIKDDARIAIIFSIISFHFFSLFSLSSSPPPSLTHSRRSSWLWHTPGLVVSLPGSITCDLSRKSSPPPRVLNIHILSVQNQRRIDDSIIWYEYSSDHFRFNRIPRSPPARERAPLKSLYGNFFRRRRRQQRCVRQARRDDDDVEVEK